MNKELLESILERKEGIEKVIKDLKEQAEQYKTNNTELHKNILRQEGFLMALEVVLADYEYHTKK